MSTLLKPMLAASVTKIDKIEYPVMLSPKLDGIRIIITPEGPRTRTLKPIPNLHIRKMLSAPEFLYLDGELIVGEPTDPKVFNNTQSAVMSVQGEPAFSFLVFDKFEHPERPYRERFEDAQASVEARKLTPEVQCYCVTNQDVSDKTELVELAANMVSFLGYEGVMIRNPDAPYKFGRATERSGALSKIKPFADAEAKITGFEFIRRNGNEGTTNALGRTQRSSHKANMIEDATQMGALIVVGFNGEFEGVEFKIGTGFSRADRQALANEKDTLVGRTVTYVYQKEGAVDAPRFPRFKGFRDPLDILDEDL